MLAADLPSAAILCCRRCACTFIVTLLGCLGIRYRFWCISFCASVKFEFLLVFMRLYPLFLADCVWNLHRDWDLDPNSVGVAYGIVNAHVL